MNIKYLILIFILKNTICFCQNKKHTNEEFLIARKVSDIKDTFNYEPILFGYQICSFENYPSDEFIKSCCDKQKPKIMIDQTAIVKGTDGKFHLIVPYKDFEWNCTNSPVITFINYSEQNKKRETKQEYNIAVFKIKYNKSDFIASKPPIGSRYYYRVQLFALSRYLNPYEITELKDTIEEGNILYEFDNETKLHKYLLETPFYSIELAEERIVKLKLQNQSINPSKVRYGSAEIRIK